MFGGSAFAAAPFAATGSSTFNVSIDESANIVDTFVAKPIFRANITESSTGAETVSVAASVFTALVAELATGADSVSVAASSFGANIAETTVATDAATVVASTFSAQIAETVVALDQIYAYALFICVVTESSTILDVATARLLWEVINDSQTAGWQTINAAQSTTWATINDSVPNTWSDIPTLD
jgi:hypothetical protein